MGLLNLLKKKDKCFCKYVIEIPLKAYELDDTSKEISGIEVFKYLQESTKEDVCNNFEYSNLQNYFGDIGKRIINMKMNFIENGVIHIEVFMREELPETGKEDLLGLIRGQLSDGWGESEFCFSKDDTEYQLLFWSNDDWYIKYITPNE